MGYTWGLSLFHLVRDGPGPAHSSLYQGPHVGLHVKSLSNGREGGVSL